MIRLSHHILKIKIYFWMYMYKDFLNFIHTVCLKDRNLWLLPLQTWKRNCTTWSRIMYNTCTTFLNWDPFLTIVCGFKAKIIVLSSWNLNFCIVRSKWCVIPLSNLSLHGNPFSSDIFRFWNPVDLEFLISIHVHLSDDHLITRVFDQCFFLPVYTS